MTEVAIKICQQCGDRPASGDAGFRLCRECCGLGPESVRHVGCVDCGGTDGRLIRTPKGLLCGDCCIEARRP